MKKLKALLETLDESQLERISLFSEGTENICKCKNGWQWVKPNGHTIDRYAADLQVFLKDGEHVVLLDNELNPVCIATPKEVGYGLTCRNNGPASEEVISCVDELQDEEICSNYNIESKKSDLVVMLETLDRAQLEDLFADTMMLLDE